MLAIGGLVIACIDEGASGQAVARMADSLARRLGSRLLLATVAQPLAGTPPGGDVTSGLVRSARPASCTLAWLAATTSRRRSAWHSASPLNG